MSGLIEGICKGRFLIVGRVGMDLSAAPPGTRTQDATELMADIGGSAANTAVGLVKLGAESALVTCVSDDAVGRFCVAGLGRYGVDARHVSTVGGERRTSLAIYESRLEDHQTVLYRNHAADFAMDLPHVEAVDYSSWGALLTAGTVFAAEPSRSAAFRAIELARAAGLPVIFDVDYRPYSWPSAQIAARVLRKAAESSDMIVANDEEFGVLAGHPDKGLTSARTLAQSGRLVIYKMGPGGAITLHEGRETRSGIFPVTALKPTGAGDSFMSGLLASLAAGHPLDAAVLRGSACAAITVSGPLCSPSMPDTARLETFLASHPGPTQPNDEAADAHPAL
ncbi:MAG: 5-dehydro-2-deoxygluconokinase [Pseudomonadota bacterium]